MMSFDEKTYDGTVFTEIDPYSKNASGKEFYQCRFENCDLTSVDFSGSRFEKCTFEGCNLSLARIHDCRFLGVKFSQCKLTGNAFDKCDSFLLDIAFEGCFISNCNFSKLNLKKTPFRSCEILETDFIGTQLVESDFSHSSLAGSVFNSCDLSKANFADARAYIINPENNKVKKARFSMPEALGLLQHLDIVIL